MLDEEWVAMLKPGDEVRVRTCYMRTSGDEGLAKVLRRTPGGQVLVKVQGSDKERRFSPIGYEVKRNDYFCVQLRPVDSDSLDPIERAILLARLASVKWDDVSLEALRQVVRLLPVAG